MQKSVTFRIDAEKVDFLDQLAMAVDRDRSYLLNEAVESYIDVKKWHLEEITAAITEANAGDFAGEDEVQAALAAFKQNS